MKRRQAATVAPVPPLPTQDEVAAAFATLLRAVSRPMEPHGPEPLMTPAETARWARVSEDTLERWRTLGLMTYGEGRIRRYRASEILAFLASLPTDEPDDIEERARKAAQKVNEVVRGVDPQARRA